MRNRLRAMAVCVVLAMALGGCRFFSDDGAEEYARTFVKALASGTSAEVAQLTNAPTAELAVIDHARDALAPKRVTSRIDKLDESAEGATVGYTMTWQLPQGQRWSYRAAARLIKDDRRPGGWVVLWSPSVLHPKLAAGQTLAIRKTATNPGRVLDRDGATLLESQPVMSVVLHSAEANGSGGGVTAVARTLAASLSQFDDTITAESIADGANRSADKNGAYLVATLREDDYRTVKSAIYDLPGVTFSKGRSLLAQDRSFGSQVLSAVRAVAEKRAADRSGWRVVTQDASGAEVAELYTARARASSPLRTTLSLPVQDAAENAVDDVDEQAMLVALQPSSGDILAVAQNAAADAEGSIALTGQYPPGSTFKIATALAGMRSGNVAPDSTVDCPGTTVIDNRRLSNDGRFQLGKVGFDRAFARSCNTTFAQLSADLPAAALTTASRDLGIGTDFVIDGITTITGEVPPAQDTVQRAENGIGQGKVLASPFGMALVAATVQTGRTPVPSLWKHEPTRVTRVGKPLPDVPVRTLRDMMRKVVTEGTATQLVGLGDVHGKTGTAQFGDGVHAHGWFIGYRDDLAFAALIINGESSQPAVELTREFLNGLP